MTRHGQIANRHKPLIFGAVFFLSAVLAGCTKSSNQDSSSIGTGAPDQAQAAQAISSVADPPPAVDPTPMQRILDTNPDNDFFSKGTIPDFRIEAGEDALRQLKRDPRTFVHVDVVAEEVTYHDVGMHLKGRRGSFRSLDSKPGLTLMFNKFNKGQRFHGLEKIHLNNSVQDASFMTEIICSRMFREAGVPAARATNARVTLNGRRLGFYVLVEGITKDFLRLYFDDPRGNARPDQITYRETFELLWCRRRRVLRVAASARGVTLKTKKKAARSVRRSRCCILLRAEKIRQP